MVQVDDRVMFVRKYPGTVKDVDGDVAFVVFDHGAFGAGQHEAWVFQHSLEPLPCA